MLIISCSFARRASLLAGLAALFVAVPSGVADDWPQWLGPRRDGIWRETGLIERFPAGGPKIRWRTPVGAGYAGPAVGQGKVILMDRRLKQGAANPANPFDRGQIPGTERILALDSRTGQTLWQHEYDCSYTVSYASGPRVTPVIDGGLVYVLGAEGNLKCLDVAKGTVQWEMDFNEKYGLPTPLWGFAGHPLVDGHKLICLVGGENSVAVAFDKRTGRELWRALGAKEPGYAPPTILELGGRRDLVIWHPESVNGLDPETGQVRWSHPWKIQSALTISTPKVWNKDHLFLTSFYNGSLLLKVGEDAKPHVVWQSKKVSEKDTDGLHSIMSTPVIDGDYVYGVCSYGQLRGLKIATGERLWETLEVTTPKNQPIRWANAFLVPNGDRVWLANELGDLILARLTPEGYREVDRVRLLEPTDRAAGRDVVWSHPAFAEQAIFLRNDRELVCVDLKK